MLAVITYPDRHEEITVPRSRPNNFLKKLLNSIYVWTRNNILIPIPAVYPETISLEDQQAILEGPIKVIYIDGDRDIVMVINGDEGAMRNLPINALASDRCLAFAQTHPEKYFMSNGISEILSLKGLIFISNTFNLWNKSSLKLPNSISCFKSLLDEQINLTSTLMSLLPFTLLNF